MQKLLVALFLFIVSINKISAQNYYSNVHGTLIFVATGRDGIMLAVDSRLTLTDKGKAIGIVDSIDKIYSLKGFSVCYEGTGLLDSTKFLSATFREYSLLSRNRETFSQAIKGYIEYMKSNYNQQLKTSLKDNIFIFTGYENKKPYVTIWSPSEPGTTFNAKDSVFECTNDKAKSYFGVYDPKSSCLQLSKQAIKAIDKYIAENKSLAAGKPVRAIMVKPNNAVVSLNRFRGKQFYTTADFNRAVNKKTVTVFMIKEE